MSSPAQRLRACRQQRWRRRQARGLVALTIEIPEHEVAAALLESGVLSADQVLDRHEMSAAIGSMVAAWASAYTLDRLK